MELGRPIVAATHLLLAASIAIVAIVGIFGVPGHATSFDDNPISAITGGFWFSFLIVLPLAGIVSLGVADWQAGRGSGILRAADLAAFLLAALELSAGTAGIIRWLVGAIALLAAAGIAGSVLVDAPRRPGFRR